MSKFNTYNMNVRTPTHMPTHRLAHDVIIDKHSFESFIMRLILPMLVFVELGHDHNSSDQTESKLKTVRK